jgi:flagellar basal-body rod modification protein FlgD
MSTIDTSTTGTTGTSLKSQLQAAQDKASREVSYSNGIVAEGDTTAFKGEASMGKDQFLKLLVTQLQFQDPLNPQDDTQFVAQLAQFSTLETNQNTSASVTQLSETMAKFMDTQMLSTVSSTNAASIGLLGKTVRVQSDDLTFDGSNPIAMDVHVAEKGSPYLEIANADGDVVLRQPMGTFTEGADKAWTWSGLDDAGKEVPAGKYTARITDFTGEEVLGYPYSEDTVNGVNFTDSGAQIEVGGSKYGIGDLKQVVETKTNA